jgi:transcriptional regulator with XRE-family HTH domain
MAQKEEAKAVRAAQKEALKAAELAFIAEFQPRLIAARERRGLTQLQVATYLGMPKSTYKKYENRKSSLLPIYLLPELSILLEEPIAYFFSGIRLPRRVHPRLVSG